MIRIFLYLKTVFFSFFFVLLLTKKNAIPLLLILPSEIKDRYLSSIQKNAIYYLFWHRIATNDNRVIRQLTEKSIPLRHYGLQSMWKWQSYYNQTPDQWWMDIARSITFSSVSMITTFVYIMKRTYFFFFLPRGVQEDRFHQFLNIYCFFYISRGIELKKTLFW